MKAAVAPYAGAWIETLCTINADTLYRSRPTRARGLKPCTRRTPRRPRRSRPTRARGLKPGVCAVPATDRGSRPTRARGLKLSRTSTHYG